jgi:hypothetical protein
MIFIKVSSEPKKVQWKAGLSRRRLYRYPCHCLRIVQGAHIPGSQLKTRKPTPLLNAWWRLAIQGRVVQHSKKDRFRGVEAPDYTEIRLVEMRDYCSIPVHHRAVIGIDRVVVRLLDLNGEAV